MEWYLKVVKQYVDFNGRARRKEFWMFTLFNIIFAIVAAVLDNILGLTASAILPYGPLYGLYSLAMLIPGIAVSVRRLHDRAQSGWMLLIGLIPIVGAIWLLVLFVLEGTPDTNKYGANPKAAPEA